MFLKGDINNDGIISGADVVYLASGLLGLSGYDLPDNYITNLNTSETSINYNDVISLASYIAKLPNYIYVNFDGKMVYNNLEGGFYGLIDNSGINYLPIPQSDISDNLKVHNINVQGLLKI